MEDDEIFALEGSCEEISEMKWIAWERMANEREREIAK